MKSLPARRYDSFLVAAYKLNITSFIPPHSVFSTSCHIRLPWASFATEALATFRTTQSAMRFTIAKAWSLPASWYWSSSPAISLWSV